MVIALVVALAFTACGGDDDGGGGGVSGGSLTITDLPSGSYYAGIFPSGTDISTMNAVYGTAFNKSVASGSNTDDGNVITLKTLADKSWTGSGNFPVLLSTGNQYRYATVSFSNGIGTAQYSSFTLCSIGDGLTITELPSGDYIVNIFPSGTDISTMTAFYAALPSVIAAGNNNGDGNVFGPLMTPDMSEVWTGSGDFMVLIWNTTFTYYYATVAISFSNGIGTAQYSSFTAW